MASKLTNYQLFISAIIDAIFISSYSLSGSTFNPKLVLRFTPNFLLNNNNYGSNYSYCILYNFDDGSSLNNTVSLSK